MAAVTRLGLGGFSRGLYGSFSGKALDTAEAPHNPGNITRLGLAGITRGLYGSFSGKAEEDAEVVATPRNTGGWLPADDAARKAFERKRTEDREEVLATLEMAYRVAMGEVLPEPVAEVVREAANDVVPRSSRRKVKLPPVKAVNFDAFARHQRAVDELLQWYELKLEDEAVALLLLVA